MTVKRRAAQVNLNINGVNLQVKITAIPVKESEERSSKEEDDSSICEIQSMSE